MHSFMHAFMHSCIVPTHHTTQQGNENARKKGIGVVMRKDGSIIRRGLGQPDWREARSGGCWGGDGMGWRGF